MTRWWDRPEVLLATPEKASLQGLSQKLAQADRALERAYERWPGAGLAEIYRAEDAVDDIEAEIENLEWGS